MAVELLGHEKQLGIQYCINCIGLHPDQSVTRKIILQRLTNPQSHVFTQWQAYAHKLDLYRDKSCMTCGRTYDERGICDEKKTWTLTAKRVKQEFERAGIFGITDKEVEQVVAVARRAYLKMYQKRRELALNPAEMESYTFAHIIAAAITGAQEGRKVRMDPSAKNKGILR